MAKKPKDVKAEWRQDVATFVRKILAERVDEGDINEEINFIIKDKNFDTRVSASALTIASNWQEIIDANPHAPHTLYVAAIKQVCRSYAFSPTDPRTKASYKKAIELIEEGRYLLG